MALAVSVLPVPGLPYNSTPVGQGTMFRVPVNKSRRQRYNEYLRIHTESKTRGIMSQKEDTESESDRGSDRGREGGK